MWLWSRFIVFCKGMVYWKSTSRVAGWIRSGAKRRIFFKIVYWILRENTIEKSFLRHEQCIGNRLANKTLIQLKFPWSLNFSIASSALEFEYIMLECLISVDPQDSVDPSYFQISVDRQYPVDISDPQVDINFSGPSSFRRIFNRSSKFSRH